MNIFTMDDNAVNDVALSLKGYFFYNQCNESGKAWTQTMQFASAVRLAVETKEISLVFHN